MGRYDLAIEDFDYVIKKMGKKIDDGGDCFCDRGEALLGMNRYEEAISDFDKGIALSKNVMEDKEEIADYCYYLRGKLYYSLSEFEKALENVNIAIKINDEKRSYFDLRSKIHTKLGHVKDAKKDLSVSNSLKPEEDDDKDNL
jgi:tetratricopeptide (TPR) repeat protein